MSLNADGQAVDTIDVVHDQVILSDQSIRDIVLTTTQGQFPSSHVHKKDWTASRSEYQA